MLKLTKDGKMTEEIINGLKKIELTRLEDVLLDMPESKENDQLITLVVKRMTELEDTKRDDDLQQVASTKTVKEKATTKGKAIKTTKDKKEAPKTKEAPKNKGKKETPKIKEKATPQAKEALKAEEAPKKGKEVTQVDFSKYSGYELERIFRSNYSSLNKEDKKVHNALNKEYESLKRGDKINITVEGDINNEYGVAPCTVVYRDNVSAIAVDIETYSKYELNRITWAKREIVKHRVLENGTVETMILLIDKVN